MNDNMTLVEKLKAMGFTWKAVSPGPWRETFAHDQSVDKGDEVRQILDKDGNEVFRGDAYSVSSWLSRRGNINGDAR